MKHHWINLVRRAHRYDVVNRIALHLRGRYDLKEQQAVARYWHDMIQCYLSEVGIPPTEQSIPRYDYAPLVSLGSKPIVWQYWGQGTREREHLPETVKLSFDSVDRYCSETYTIIRLSDDTIRDYIELPAWVYQKLSEGAFSRTFFSDLLRIVLLTTYGGLWLDATVVLSAPPKFGSNIPELFLYTRDYSTTRSDQLYWGNFAFRYFSWSATHRVTMLSSIMAAQANHPVLRTMADLLLYYWQTEHRLSHYFLMQILFHEMVHTHMPEAHYTTESDCLPHLLHAKVAKGGHNISQDSHLNQVAKRFSSYHLDKLTYQELFGLVAFHKLTYFDRNVTGHIRSELGL